MILERRIDLADLAMRSHSLLNAHQDPIILYVSEQTRYQVSDVLDFEDEDIENFILFNNDPVDDELFISMFRSVDDELFLSMFKVRR